MNILYVINNLFSKGNGLSASARRTVQALREAGEAVKVLSAANPDAAGERPDYILPDYKVPVFHKLIQKQGYSFAAPDDHVIREAIRWADVVHLEEPFAMQIRTCRIARELGVPCTATYHLHPENFYASIRLQHSVWNNHMTLRVWRDTVFNHCKIIQCPTESVRARLEKWHFKSELRVISNGLVLDNKKTFSPKKITPDQKRFFTVICTGRYSVEKDQITLLRAMRHSQYADRIQLIFAGRGPTEKLLRKVSDKLLHKGVLKNPPIFGFYSLDELQALYENADLYIHCATIEVEGLSCMEAIQTGLVPVIAEGELTATSQFAKNSKSIYPAQDAKALAERIDYWLAHNEERQAEAELYLDIGNEYDIKKSVTMLIQMYQDVLNI